MMSDLQQPPAPSKHLVEDMEEAGFTVRLDTMPDGRFRVRVSRKAPRYNVHTTSTGGMSTAIGQAHRKWRQAIEEGEVTP